MIGEMVEAGMNVLRINMSHASHAFAKQVIADLREYTEACTSEVAVCLDINGPKVRTGKLVNGEPVHLRIGEEMMILNTEVLGDSTQVRYSHKILSSLSSLQLTARNLWMWVTRFMSMMGIYPLPFSKECTTECVAVLTTLVF